MKVVVTPHSLSEIHDNYKAAIKWLASIGFQIERGRLQQYGKILTTLSDNYPENGWGDFENESYRIQVTTMLLEVRELVSIYKGLSASSDANEFNNEIKHYLKGPFRVADEKPSNASNRARNIGFELYLNSIFLKAGFKPEYDTAADLSFNVGNARYFVEAKRPTTNKAIKNVITDANSQLNCRLKSSLSKKNKGLIALDLTKIINPDDKIMPVHNEEYLFDLMYNEDKLQIDSLRKFWNKKKHKRTIGVLLHYRLLTNFYKNEQLSTVKWIGAVALCDDPEFSLITNKLQNVVREIC